MKKFLAVLITMSLFFFHYTTINAQDNIILFHSNSCGYSKDLIMAIQEAEIDEILTIEMVEASEEDFDEIFNKSLEECNIQRSRAGFPTLFHNGDCSVGSLNALNTLFDLAGIERNEEFEEQDIEQMTEIEEIRTLSEIEQEVFEVEPRPFWQILVMLIGPAILIGLAYFMIKKLNL